MRRWQYAVAGAVAAAMLFVGGSGPAQAAHNCSFMPSHEPPGLLYHGTSAVVFDNGTHFPRGPAWLGPNREFSIHAALRFVVRSEQPIRLLAYRHRRPMTIVECKNTAEFRQYAIEKGWQGRQTEDTTIRLDAVLARFLCNADRVRVNRRLIKPHGYIMREDAVRREVEYIICNPPAILHFGASLQQVVLTMPVGDKRHWATKGPDGVFMLLTDHGLQCFIKLPENHRLACPVSGTLPRVGCCSPPPLPPRSHR